MVYYFTLSMAEIISTSVKKDDVIISLKLTRQEYMELSGHYDDILCLAKAAVVNPAKIYLPGQQSSTKYFLIPKNIRDCLPDDSEVKCQKIDTSTAHIIVYVVQKD